MNEQQKRVMIDKIDDHFGGNLRGKTIAVWGLAFKPRTDDIREAPALVLIDWLLSQGAAVRVHDPEAMDNVRGQYGDKLTYCAKPMDALDGADALAIMTEWGDYQRPDFTEMFQRMRSPGDLRRPQPVRALDDGTAGLHVPQHRPPGSGEVGLPAGSTAGRQGALMMRAMSVPARARLSVRRPIFLTQLHRFAYS